MSTLDDVAREAGVSAMTVSNALRGRPHVKPKTKQKVVDAARKLNYRVNIPARKLSSGSTRILGFAAVDLDNGFPAALAADFCDTAASRGYQTIVQQTRRSSTYEQTMSQDVMNQLCDGLLLCSPAMTEQNIEELDSRIPTVLFDTTRFETQFDSIVTPCAPGGKDATQHLIAQGCRNIIVIGTNYKDPKQQDNSWSPAARRLSGCIQACREAGLPLDSDRVFPTTWELQDACDTVHRIVESGIIFDGIFCVTDHIAPGILRALAECGLSVPADVCVASFDGVPIDAFMEPPLTSITIDTKEIAEKAIARLMERIEHKQGNIRPERIIVGYRLAVRGSSLRKS